MFQNESSDPFGGNVYYVTMQITFLARTFRNGERNLNCDVVHITTKWVSSLTLDCNGVFAIKAYRGLLEWTTSLDTSSRTLFVREDMCRDVHVTSNVELRNNVRLLLNVELRNITSDC